jgi:hypothetical protein
VLSPSEQTKRSHKVHPDDVTFQLEKADNNFSQFIKLAAYIGKYNKVGFSSSPLSN